MDLVVPSMCRSTVMFLPALPPRNGVAIVPRGPSWNYSGAEGAAHPYSMVAALKEYFSPIEGLFFHRMMYRTGKHDTEPMGFQYFSETAAEGQEIYLGASTSARCLPVGKRLEHRGAWREQSGCPGGDICFRES